MTTKNLIYVALIAIVIASISACNFNQSKTTSDSIDQLSIDSVKSITKEAYIYGYPMIDAYRIEYAYFVDSKNPEFKAPWNTLRNIPHVFTAADIAIQTPNSDTPYSFAGLDLRAEPIILVVPKIDKKRYFSIQLVDSYTQNFDYIGSRTTGNGGGVFMIAGPNWKGETPEGVTKVFNSETELVLAGYRTQLFNAADIDNVKRVQAGYKVKPLSAYLGIPAPPAVAPIDFALPLTPAEEKVSIESLNILNFILQFCPTVPSEKELMERFAKIGVGAGKAIDIASLSPEVKAAMEAGIKEAWDKDYAGLKKKMDDGEITSGDLFGTRAYLKNNYLYRMTAAVLGIFGNSKKEAMYPIYNVDADEQSLDATTNKYTLHFAADELPPVNAFWSLTMYKLPSSLLVANPLHRYLLNSPMLTSFKRDKDNGITFYIQNESPGKDKESNWLPAPKGPFMAVLRLYWPKESALDGNWKNPPMQLVK
jgi:hypothetical protein